MYVQLIAIFCVFGICLGQLLFKLSGVALNETGSFFNSRTLLILLTAFTLYGITSIAWVWVLQRIELGRIYPYMAMAFILVPIGSHYLFNENFNTQYFIGVALIVLGIIVTVKSN